MAEQILETGTGAEDTEQADAYQEFTGEPLGGDKWRFMAIAVAHAGQRCGERRMVQEMVDATD